MLSLLKIKKIALIDELEIEFGPGLNLLTGETGSGKSIIVDSLGALTGERVSSDLIMDGEESAQIEGLFIVKHDAHLTRIFDDAGIEIESGENVEIIVRRELSQAGRNRIFVNNQLVTRAFLKQLGGHLVDIHGQGEQAALYNTSTHLEMLDEYAGLQPLRQNVADAHRHWSVTKTELGMLSKNESEKLQMMDILRFEIAEIDKAAIGDGEEERLDDEKLRLNNVEKLTAISQSVFSLLYDDGASTGATLEKAIRKTEELVEFETTFGEYIEGLRSAQAVIEDLAIAVRNYRDHLEYSPQRLAEIEDRLAELSRLKRKYGGTMDTVFAHLRESRERLENIETAEFREEELKKRLAALRAAYLKLAGDLHEKRKASARKFEKQVETNLKEVALEKAKFEVRIERSEADSSDARFTAKGIDSVEFYFSANPGEVPKPLAKVASGGEASRLMLILKTTAKTGEYEKTAVFDEIDIGIGGRVAEAVGLKLKDLSKSQQVLCVTHQPQIASLADRHFAVEKVMTKNRTSITARELTEPERVEEIARMLAGEKISDTVRDHARELLAATN